MGGTEHLKNEKVEGVVTDSGFATDALLTEIPPNARQPAQITFKNSGTGTWYISMADQLISSPGLANDNYSIALGAGEAFTEDNPPIGEVHALWEQDSSTDNGELSFYGSWRREGPSQL